MTIHMMLEAKDLAELGKTASDIANACGAGTVTHPNDVDPETLLQVLNAWAEERGGAVRLILTPRKGQMGRPKYLTAAELEALAEARDEEVA